MASAALEGYVNRLVSVITADGRNFVGTLKGFDQVINLILEDTHERVFSPNAGVEQVVLGLHIVRGDNIAVIGSLKNMQTFATMKIITVNFLWQELILNLLFHF